MRPPSEPQYVEFRLRRPSSAWPFLRLASVAATIALIVTLVREPDTGLFVFWELIVPLLPLTFLALPGLWRNICPMAAVNQAPRVLGITRALPLPRWLERHGYALGLVLFFGIVSSRSAGLDGSAQGVALLIGGVLVLPLLGGLAFRGKSGWCGSSCPLRAVQGLYGQTPAARIEPSHCRPCVGCTTNCPDVEPHDALAGELRAEEGGGPRYRRLFAGAFPGFALAFFALPGADEVGLATMYGQFAVLMLASLGSFFVLESTGARAERLVAFYGAAAFGTFYWFSVPIFADAVGEIAGGPAPQWAVWEGRFVMIGLAFVWLVRTLRKSRRRSQGESARPLPMAPAAALEAEVEEAAPEPAPVALPKAAPAETAAPEPRPQPARREPKSVRRLPREARPPERAKTPPKVAPAPKRPAAPAQGKPKLKARAKAKAKAPAPAKPSAERPAASAPVPAPPPRPTAEKSKPAKRPMAGTPAVPVPDRRSRDRPLRTPQVTLMPEGRRLETAPGATLLDVASGNDLGVESGCRMGLCGCDPVYVCDGRENLSPAEPGELATIERLELPPHTRMACVARVLGDVVISLDPTVEVEATAEPAAPAVAPASRASPAPAEAAAPEAAASLTTSSGNGTAPADGGRARPRRRDRASEDVKKVVVIGNGIAGVTAADHIRRHHGECSIDMVTDERHPFYNRTSVSRLIHARTGMHRMYLLPDSWYEERRINSWLNTNATKVDREARKVHLGTGEKLSYDRLILATGSSANVPPIEGYGVDGCFSLRSADDAMRIREYAQASDCSRAMVVGGGVLGLEAAEALRELQIDVGVIERAFWLAPSQLDARAGRIVRDHMVGLGMDVVLGTGVKSIKGRYGRVSALELDDGTVRPTDLVLVCAGVIPNVSLAREAGLRVNRGVVVDDRMRTSDPTIVAAGDVAEHAGRCYGLWGAAVEQAEVAAINALGSGATYAPSMVPTHLKVDGLDLTSIGEPHGGSGGAEIVPEDVAEGEYRKLVLAEGRIVGAIMVGRPHESATVLAAMRGNRDVRGDVEALQAGDWSVLNESEFERAVTTAPLARHVEADSSTERGSRAASR